MKLRYTILHKLCNRCIVILWGCLNLIHTIFSSLANQVRNSCKKHDNINVKNITNKVASLFTSLNFNTVTA